MHAFVLGFVFSIPSLGSVERLWNDLFCVEWDVKTLTQSGNQFVVCKFLGLNLLKVLVYQRFLLICWHSISLNVFRMWIYALAVLQRDGVVLFRRENACLVRTSVLVCMAASSAILIGMSLYTRSRQSRDCLKSHTGLRCVTLLHAFHWFITIANVEQYYQVLLFAVWLNTITLLF